MAAAGSLQTAGGWGLRRDQMILPAARIVSPKGKQGSGFVVAVSSNGTYVLTNHHIIDGCIQQSDRWDPVEKSSSKVERLLPVSVEIFRYDDRGRYIQTLTTQAEIVAYRQYGDEWDFEGDLALLRLRAPVEGVPAASIIDEEDYEEEVRMLDEIIMVGCPEGAEVPLPTTGHIASMTEERAGVGLLLSQIFGNPGSSGSAVYRYSVERGRFEVIAVHSMVDQRGSLTDSGSGSFLRLAVPAPSLHSFLRNHGFPDLVGSKPPVVDEPAPEGLSPADDDKVHPDDVPPPSGDDDSAPTGSASGPAVPDGTGDAQDNSAEARATTP